MGGPPHQRTELHHADEPAQVVHLGLLVLLAVHHAREVKQLGTLVHLRPEPLLEVLLGALQRLGVLEGVEVREDAHDPGEAVHLTDVEELKDLHFEAEGGVDEEQHEVGDLGHVDHGVDVVRALDEGEAAALARHYSHGALGGQRLENRDEGSEMGGLRLEILELETLDYMGKSAKRGEVGANYVEIRTI